MAKNAKTAECGDLVFKPDAFSFRMPPLVVCLLVCLYHHIKDDTRSVCARLSTPGPRWQRASVSKQRSFMKRKRGPTVPVISASAAAAAVAAAAWDLDLFSSLEDCGTVPLSVFDGEPAPANVKRQCRGPVPYSSTVPRLMDTDGDVVMEPDRPLAAAPVRASVPRPPPLPHQRPSQDVKARALDTSSRDPNLRRGTGVSATAWADDEPVRAPGRKPRGPQLTHDFFRVEMKDRMRARASALPSHTLTHLAHLLAAPAQI